MSDLAVRYVDDRGRVRWQPLDQYGRGEVWIPVPFEADEVGWRSGDSNRPRLYRSRRHAESIARRKNRQDDKSDASVFKKAQDG